MQADLEIPNRRPERLIADAPVDYGEAVAAMEQRVAAIRAGTASELLWFLEHPPLYTAGTSAREEDLLTPDRFPVFQSGRGGQYTYHGPGQRVVYVLLDLQARGLDLRDYVWRLEEWAIRALNRFNLRGERRQGRVGIWVETGGGREDKVAAIGVRVRRWVTYHGLSINLDPELEHFSGIVPCGIAGHGVTSLTDLGYPVMMADLDQALIDTWAEVFEAVA